jgi:hypothetical protein
MIGYFPGADGDSLGLTCNSRTFSMIRIENTPKGCREISQGLSREAAQPLVSARKPLHPSRDAGNCEITLPVVTLASLANHRLISVHPFGVRVSKKVRSSVLVGKVGRT